MKGFNQLPLVTKILCVAIFSLSVLTIVLFVLYAVNAREQTVNAFVEKARAVTLTAESTREEMEAKWGQGIMTIDKLKAFLAQREMDKVLSMVPVVSAWNAAMRKAEDGGYTFRVPKFDARRPENNPDFGNDYAIEGPALQKIKDENLDEYYEIGRAHV